MLGLKNRRRQRLLQRQTGAQELWQHIVAEQAMLCGLAPQCSVRLRDLAILFLHEKQFIAQENLELDERARLTISAQACLPILNLAPGYASLNYYRGWSSLVIYPEHFWVLHQSVDNAGVLHTWREPRSGEAWPTGPVVLSWADVLSSNDGFNVIIHELAHKLDMLNGSADGFPPLHDDMSAKLWTSVFSRAYEDFCQQVNMEVATSLDPYAAESPGEFFAVMSEAFFCQPHVLRRQYPHVYSQLRSFYRQDPAARFSMRSASSEIASHEIAMR